MPFEPVPLMFWAIKLNIINREILRLNREIERNSLKSGELPLNRGREQHLAVYYNKCLGWILKKHFLKIRNKDVSNNTNLMIFFLRKRSRPLTENLLCAVG